MLLAFTPASASDECAHGPGRAGLLGTFAKVEARAQKQHLSASEADAAIAEAMSAIRNRE